MLPRARTSTTTAITIRGVISGQGEQWRAWGRAGLQAAGFDMVQDNHLQTVTTSSGFTTATQWAFRVKASGLGNVVHIYEMRGMLAGVFGDACMSSIVACQSA